MRQLKHFSIKFLAAILSVLMVMYLLPLTTLAEAFQTADKSNSNKSRGQSDNIYELESLREESVKHFRLEDGSYIAVQYSNPVHTLDDNGKWQDIDNTLSSSGSEFSTGNARVKFAKKITGNESLFTIHDGNGKITLSLDGAKKKTAGKVTNTSTEFDKDATKLTKLTTLDKLSAKILYADILDDVDIEYIAESLNIKENIIVKKASDSYSYTFTLKLNNLTAEQRADGSIVISSPTNGKTVYKIPKGYMFDADGNRSGAVSYSLSQIGNGRYSLCVTADSEWINAEGRAFPVTIDPTVNYGEENSATAEYITIASDNDENHNGMRAGYYSDGHNRVLIRKTGIIASSLPAGSVVTNATLTLTVGDYEYSDYYAVREILEDWDSDTTWNDMSESSFSSVITDFRDISKSVINESWDITSIARKWYAGQPNYGVSIYPVTETATEGKNVDFTIPYSTPFLSVTYRNVKGIEDYYTYSSFGVGLGGASYINDFSGNLVHILGTTSTTDSLMPYMPSLVYNANMSGKFFTSSNAITPVTVASAAYGFKLSTQETISSKVIDGVQYYVWSDSDGTEHYFSMYYDIPDEAREYYCYDIAGNVVGEFDNGYREIYHDEDGLGLKIEQSDTGFTLMADNGVAVGNQKNPDINAPFKHFNQAGYLDWIVDSNGNKRVFTLDSNNRVTSISLVPKGFAAITQLTFAYNSSGMLKSITNSINGDAVTFYYSETPTGTAGINNAGYLRKLEYFYPCVCGDPSDNCDTTKTVEIKYNSAGYITSVTDEASKYRLSYSYTNGKVTSIAESAASEGSDTYTVGQTIEVAYRDGQTEYYFEGKDGVLDSPSEDPDTDDIKTVFVFDNYGRTITSYTTDRATGRTLYGSNNSEYTEDSNGAKKNKIISRLNVGSSPVNYLCNAGFESGNTNYWVTNRGTSSLQVYNSHSGNYCAYLPPKQNNTRTYMNQHYVLEKGTYTLSGYVMASAATGVNTFLRVFIQDSQGSSAVGSSEAVTYRTSREYTSNWVRVSYTFDVPTDGRTYYIEICNDGTSGVYYDDLMLERASGAGNLSYASSGSFAYAGYWTYAGRNTSVIPASVENSQCIALNGTPNGTSSAKQRIYFGVYDEEDAMPYSISSDNVFILSGWAKAASVPTNGSANFELRAKVHYFGGSEEVFKIPFNWQTDEWQFTSGLITLQQDGEVEYIEIYCIYENNANTAYFDSISLVIDSNAGTSYDYDSFGRLTDVKNSDGVKSKNYTYSDSRLSKITSNRMVTDTEYDNYGNVTKVNQKLRKSGQIYFVLDTTTNYEYNAFGQIISATTHADTDETEIYKKTYQYSESASNFGAILREVDAGADASIRYRYDDKGNLITTIDPRGYGLDYTYDNFGNITSVTIRRYTDSTGGTDIPGAPVINYLYDGKDQLSKITTESAEYTFTYDAFGNTTEIKVNGISLASYNYEGGNGKLLSLTYGNGKVVRYDYDNLDRVSKIYYNNTVACTYSYNAEGYMSEVVDYKAHIKVKYEYDTHGRNTVTNYFTFSGTNASSCEIGYAVYVDYDNIGRVSRIIYAFAGSTGSSDQLYYIPQYVDDSSIIKNWNVSINDSVDRYLYLDTDAFGRATVKNIVIDSNTLLETQYTYDSVETEDEVYDSWDGHYCGLLSLTSDRIIRYKNTYKKRIPTGTNTEKEVSTSYNYSYDASGNITGIYKYCTEINYTNGNYTSSSSKTYYTRYTYDYLNQLIREDDEEAGSSYTYEYDNAGNRTSKKRYAYTLGTLGRIIESFSSSYSYDNCLITDGCSNDSIEYDAIGNPTSFVDIDEPHNYYTNLTWDGRQLKTIIKYFCGDELYINYNYNSDGIRISKEYDDYDTGILYRWEYDLDGSTIVRVKYYNDDELTKILLFMYDENGSPFAMSVKDAGSGTVKTYYYEKNLQGDIVGIMNEAGYKVVSYTYDAWGNPYSPVYVYHSGVSATDRDNVKLNPFRYRGYYYDSETGYYYLQTRYYSPELGRFLNADGYINANGDILGYNMFAYCSNDPVNKIDPSGEIGLVLLVIGLAVLLANTPGCSPKDGADAVAQVVEDVELGPYEAQDIAHGHNSASKAYDYANTFKSLVEFADSLDDYKSYEFEYSCAVVAYRRSGKIIYTQKMLDAFGSQSIYESAVEYDSYMLDHMLSNSNKDQLNSPQYLMDNFTAWAGTTARGNIGAYCASRSLEKGYDFYKNYFDIISGSVG